VNSLTEQLIVVQREERLAAAERHRIPALLVRARKATRKAERAADRAARAQLLAMDAA
jgi:hypothetical protein